MAEDSHQLEAIISERDGLRQEIMLMVGNFHPAGFAFVTVAMIVVGIYLKKDIIQDEDTRMLLLFLLTQVAVFLQFVVVTLTANQNVHAGYIEALERKLNSICNSNACIWEHEINRNFLATPKCSFALSLIAIVIFLLLLHTVFIVMALNSGRTIFGTILLTELLLVMGLLSKSFRERYKVAEYAQRILNRKS